MRYSSSNENINRKVITSVSLLILCVFIFLGLNYKSTGVFSINKRKLPIYCVNTDEKKIAISFDSSWGSNNTIEILNILDRYDVKATFFLLGKWVDEFPEETKEIYKRGHEIGNHSDKHPNMTKVSNERMIEEISITDAKIANLTGFKTKLFRCPDGAYNDAVIDTAELTNHKCIQWDVDSIDWKEEGIDLEYNRVINKVKPGSIILFHNSAKYTPENLPRIIEKLKKDGYEFVKISDHIYKDKYYIDNNGKQTLIKD